MMPKSTHSYQPDEHEAIASFKEKGTDGTYIRLEELSNTAKLRMDECYQINKSIPVGFTGIDFLNEEERHEHHILRLSIALCIDERSEAHQRILARRKAMQTKRQSRHYESGVAAI